MESRNAHLVSGLGYLPRMSHQEHQAALYGTEDPLEQKLLRLEWEAEDARELAYRKAAAKLSGKRDPR